MKPVAAIALLLVAGCSSIFGLDNPVLVEATTDAAAGDAAISDVMADVAPDSSSPGVGCPAAYNLSYMTSRYRVVAASEWIIAAQDCADDMGFGTRSTHLVVLGNDAERSYLASLGLPGAWIGLSDRTTEGTYRWVTAEPTIYPPAAGAPWAQGEPDNALGQDCIVSTLSAQLQDTNCTATAPALCECDDYPNDPTRY
jgi:hypothetical protein